MFPRHAVVDATDGRAHHIRFRGIEAFEHAPPIGGIVEVRRFGGAEDKRPTLVLENRSCRKYGILIKAARITIPTNC
jgi:hypothetical protein